MNNDNRTSVKNIGMLIAGLIIGLSGYGQTIQQQTEKQLKDPQRKENAGKADAIISRKKNIFDSTDLNKGIMVAGKNKTGKGNAKKQHCNPKTKHGNKIPASKKEP